jgi:hypothetical protein
MYPCPDPIPIIRLERHLIELLVAAWLQSILRRGVLGVKLHLHCALTMISTPSWEVYIELLDGSLNLDSS